MASLAIGASVRIELAATAPVASATVANVASVTSSVCDPDLSNNDTTEETLVGASGDAAINEVFNHGAQAADWVELKNIGPISVDLNGWQLCASSNGREQIMRELMPGIDAQDRVD